MASATWRWYRRAFWPRCGFYEWSAARSAFDLEAPASGGAGHRHQGVTAASAERREIDSGHRVGGQQLNAPARFLLGKSGARQQHRLRTGEAAGINDRYQRCWLAHNLRSTATGFAVALERIRIFTFSPWSSLW